MSSVIKFDGVTKRYGNRMALDSVSFDVPAGVVFALLGENGAGKSTAIKTMMGLLESTSGKIEVLGLDPRKKGDEIRRRCGYIPESPALYDWMKVSEIAWFASGCYSESFLPNFYKLAEEFELPLDMKIKALSKGGRAKVSLALAMAHQPELLVLDEPTSGLDTLVRRKFLESMVDVAATGRTVLLSSHQIGEVERVADHVAIIHAGKIVACDTLDNLKSQHERWVITFSSVDNSLPDFEARIISHEGLGTRRHQMFVAKPGPEALWKLRDHTGVLDVEVHQPALEEIFVAFISHAAASANSNVNNPAAR